MKHRAKNPIIDIAAVRSKKAPKNLLDAFEKQTEVILIYYFPLPRKQGTACVNHKAPV